MPVKEQYVFLKFILSYLPTVQPYKFSPGHSIVSVHIRSHTMGSSTLSLLIFVVASIMNLPPVTLGSSDYPVEADKNALLAGPPLSCGVASDMDRDPCVNKWALELAAQGLVADFEDIWSTFFHLNLRSISK